MDQLLKVQMEIYDARPQWEQLGLALKIPVSSLDTIKEDHKGTSTRFQKMLQEWLQSGDKKTWQVLAEALGQDVVGRPDLKKKILDKHQCYANA